MTEIDPRDPYNDLQSQIAIALYAPLDYIFMANAPKQVASSDADLTDPSKGIFGDAEKSI